MVEKKIAALGITVAEGSRQMVENGQQDLTLIPQTGDPGVIEGGQICRTIGWSPHSRSRSIIGRLQLICWRSQALASHGAEGIGRPAR